MPALTRNQAGKEMSKCFKTFLVLVPLLIFASLVPAFAPETYKVGVIPKFIAEDYFIACERGFRQAEKELGNINVDWLGDVMSQTSAAMWDADVNPTARD
jgi:ABC-type sugar transport system substrate-binding protein